MKLHLNDTLWEYEVKVFLNVPFTFKSDSVFSLHNIIKRFMRNGHDKVGPSMKTSVLSLE